MKKIIIALSLILMSMLFAWGTASTQLWNPSTDTQGLGTVHLGIDDYFSVDAIGNGNIQAPTDIGITYGLLPGFEIGIDLMLPQTAPFSINAKYGLAESDYIPAIAVGGFGFGTQENVTNLNVLYGILAKTTLIGRFSAGFFSGNENILVSQLTGQKDNAGAILTWDKAINSNLWLCVDYASTNSSLGATFYGLSWLFAPNTSVIFGYGTYNSGVTKPTITAQLDINI